MRHIAHIVDAANGGECVGVLPDGRRIFVARAWVDEDVLVDEPRRQGGALRSQLLGVETKSRFRRQADCAHFDACGGCLWMHVQLGEQRRVKRQLIESALGRALDSFVVGEGLAYRRRARMHWRQQDGRTVLGYRRHRSKHTVEPAECRVLVSGLQEVWKNQLRPLGPLLQGEGTLTLALGKDGAGVVRLETRDRQQEEVRDVLRSWVRDGHLAGASFGVCGKQQEFGDPQEYVATGKDVHLAVPQDAFAQANDEINRKLIELVAELACTRGKHVVELFSGAGNLSRALAGSAQSFLAVEAHPAAALALQQALEHQPAVNVIAADAATMELPSNLDVLVMDPPRAGLPKRLVAEIGRVRPPTIVYVSCDLPTLRRDCQRLAGNGYCIDFAAGMDMFPQTSHVETVVRLVAL